MNACFQAMERRRRFHLFALMGLLPIAVALALSLGSFPMGPGDFWEALRNPSGGPRSLVVWNLRLPRIASALICGWGLALGGMILQGVLRNPLASPATLGVSQGAAFGAAFSVWLFGAGTMSMAFAAFLGGAAAAAFLLLLTWRGRLDARDLVLAGVALASLFTSATLVLQYLASETELALMLFWSFGDLARSTWTEWGVCAVVVLGASLWMLWRRWDLNAMEAGDAVAEGLGVNLLGLRLRALACVALVTGVVTAFHGVIAFLGLMAPHLARGIVGVEQRWLLPSSSLVGALLLLGADALGRSLPTAGVLPVGVLTSFLGAPTFLLLLMRRRS